MVSLFLRVMILQLEFFLDPWVLNLLISLKPTFYNILSWETLMPQIDFSFTSMIRKVCFCVSMLIDIYIVQGAILCQVWIGGVGCENY